MGEKNHDHDIDEGLDEDIVAEDDLEPTDTLKKLRAKLKSCEAEKQTNLDGWQRAQADLINHRRDANDREATARVRGAADLVERIAPALDSFHMAMQGKGWEEMPKEWKVGIQGIYSQLTGVLKEEGLEIIDPVGLEFDPNEHESMSMVAVATKDQDHVVQQTIQKGLKLNGHVIRPAKVVVGEFQA